MLSEQRYRAFVDLVLEGKKSGLYPYFRPISRSFGPEVEVDGRRLVMAGCNDYLGLAHDPRMVEAAEKAVRNWGTGPGGSRFLCGNTTLHDQLEERLAAFVGKRGALVHTTGFTANTGVLPCLASAQDLIVCDAESHASVFDGISGSKARFKVFAHNDARSAEERLRKGVRRNPRNRILVTEGVFSMSGDMAALPSLVALKRRHPGLQLYLDDAHGLGVMGPGGCGTAGHCRVAKDVDFIMGTFSKAMASIGGFVATDDEDMLTYLRHHSRPLIFSAALPAASAAAVLAALEILEAEPERVERVHAAARKAARAFREIGLPCRYSGTPIIPILVGDEFAAYHLSRDLFEHGVFVLPAVFPAVPRGKAVLRTAFMSTHTQAHLDRIAEAFAELAPKYGIAQARSAVLAGSGGA